MHALKLITQSDEALIKDYAERIGESVMRRRADIAVRAARIEAELAIKARSEFLANMNHELRTPLNAIIGFSTMLCDGEQYGLSDEQKHSYIEYILQSADLLLGHINTILEVAALESGGMELANDEVELGGLLDDAMDRARVRADAAEVKLKRRDRRREIEGWGDAERTGQALDHLLQTAIKACDKGGRVLVRAQVDDKGWAEVAVRDNGAGLTDEELKDAFDAFKQSHRGLDHSFLGPGIGYAIAKTFVEMQGGRFAIESRKGKGTLARIMLPPPNENLKARKSAEEAGDDAPANETFHVERAHDAA